MIQAKDITAVILAGGQAKRFSGQDKGLLRFGDSCLIQQVICCVTPYVDTVLISANRHQDHYHRLTGHPVVSDKTAGFKGPLYGLADALENVNSPYTLVWPCDSVPVSDAAIAQLVATLSDNREAAAVVLQEGSQPQYTCALFQTDLRESMQQVIQAGGQSMRDWYQQVQPVYAQTRTALQHFNTPVAYARAYSPVLFEKVPVLGMAGFSGVGKTTLLTQVVSQLVDSGKNIAVVKHTHHQVDVDTPGKDSYRFKESGATQVLLASSARYALLAEQTHKPESLEQFLPKLDMRGLDMILFEGFKHAAWPKIEIQRTGFDAPALYPEDPHVIAVASDAVPPAQLPWLDINQPETVAAFVQAYAEPV